MNKLYRNRNIYSGVVARLDEELCYVDEKYILKGQYERPFIYFFHE